jgi:O-methyltransferase involved in polyketide biosynthesis
VFDAWVRAFLERHPAGTVVELGAGLDTRFERLDNGRVRWFDLDLPEAIALRRRFFADAPRRTMLAASVLDPGWADVVAAGPGPWLFVAEAVLIYLAEPRVRRVLAALAERFPGCRVAFDTVSRETVAGQDANDVLRHFRARWVWACDDPRAIEGWGPGYRLEESRSLFDVPPAQRQRLPPALRAPFADLVRARPGLANAYQLNRFRLGLDP